MDRSCEKNDVDSGYAWVILTGCYIMYLIVVGSVKTYGLLFTEIDEYYGVGSGPVAIIGSLLFLLMFTAGPFANYLAVRTSFRTVAILGGLLLGFGYSISFFIVRLELLFLTLGVSAGIGYGLTFTPCSTILNFYFDKRRALANGITASASGIGSIALSFLYKYLIETYALKSALLIIGGILFNVCVAACLLRQLEPLAKQKQEHQNRKRIRKRRFEENRLNADGNTECVKEHLFIRHKEKNLNSKLNIDEQYAANLLNAEGNAGRVEEHASKRCSCVPDFKLSLFRNPRFSLYWVTFMICVAGYGSNFILIPSQIRTLGYGKLSVSTAVAIAGGSKIFARIFAGWFADKKWITPKSIFMSCYFISAVFTCITPHIHSIYYMYVYAAIIGIFPASFWSLVSVLIIDVVGMEDFPEAYGLVSLALALGYSVSQVSIGWLKDQTGDWTLSYYVTAMLFLIPAVFMLIEHLIIPAKTRLGRKTVDIAETEPQATTVDKEAGLRASNHKTDSLLADKKQWRI